MLRFPFPCIMVYFSCSHLIIVWNIFLHKKMSSKTFKFETHKRNITCHKFVLTSDLASLQSKLRKQVIVFSQRFERLFKAIIWNLKTLNNFIDELSTFHHSLFSRGGNNRLGWKCSTFDPFGFTNLLIKIFLQ